MTNEYETNEGCCPLWGISHFRKEPSSTQPQHTLQKWIKSDKAFSSKSTETNFKMAAMEATLKIAACPFSKGTFLYSTPTYPEKMDLIRQGVLLEIDGNQKLTDARTDARTDNASDDNTP